MCGILAVFGYKQDGDVRKTILRLTQRIRHRGPDWSGLKVVNSETAIAHERLSIVDVAHGAQPLEDSTGKIVLSVNGEIFNHVQLKKELKQAYPFKTASDCEVIIPLYQQHGLDFLPKLKGQYAFILYDENDNSYLVARDPIGVTSLYQGWGTDGSRWFSSEMKTLVDNCERIEVFPPGHYYSSRAGVLHRFYDPSWSHGVPSTPLDKTVLREALETAIRRRLMCDVPYGVLLSGGLDSSLVASVASRMTARRVESNDAEAAWYPRLHSFAIGIEGAPDLKAAKVVADELKTVHHEFHFTVQEGLDAIRDVIRHLETYDVTTIRASTPMYLLSRRIKATGVKMVLSGEGADEIFGGYLYFHKAPNAADFHKECSDRVLNLHFADCLRADKSTLAWGVEARVPFLDDDFLEVAMNLDPKYKIHLDENGQKRIEKHALRAAFDTPNTPYLPDSVLWRQKEQFSDGVGYSWIDSLKQSAADQITDEEMAQAAAKYPVNTPQTKEALHYRNIFTDLFPQPVAATTVMAWVPRLDWGCPSDPSGRAQAVHVQAL